MNNPNVIVSGKDVGIGYRRGKRIITIQEHLNFELRSGQLTCLLGGNGSGKTTILRTLAGAQQSLYGQIKIMENDINTYSERQRSKLIGIVLTDKTQTGGLTVFDLVSMGRQPHTGFFGRLSKHDKEIIDCALKATGINHKRNSYMAELSDGERQKAMIAKALVQECPIILLDEPTAFLDVTSRLDIMQLLHNIAHSENKAILMSTHDIEQALVMSDSLWLMKKNVGLVAGCTEDLILDNQLDNLFQMDNGIRFDSLHGTFSPQLNKKQIVYLEAKDNKLKHWLINALERNQLGYTEDKSLLTEKDYSIVALRKDYILLMDKNKRYECNSIESLIDALNKQ